MPRQTLDLVLDLSVLVENFDLRRQYSESYPDHFSRPLTVSEVLATANENGSQITCYAANDDWLFIIIINIIIHTLQQKMLRAWTQPMPTLCNIFEIYCRVLITRFPFKAYVHIKFDYFLDLKFSQLCV